MIDRRGFLGSLAALVVGCFVKPPAVVAEFARPAPLYVPTPRGRRARWEGVSIKKETTFGVDLDPRYPVRTVQLRQADLVRFREAADRNYRSLIPLDEWVGGPRPTR